MAGLNDDAQWIVLMGFLVSFSFFFLAMVINQSTVVGQTTAESVIEFPKNDIRDARGVIIQSRDYPDMDIINLKNDITTISLGRKNAIVGYDDPIPCYSEYICINNIHYNNGVTEYDEDWISP